MYRIFNVAIESELPLPELPEFDPPAGSAVYHFDVAADGIDVASRGDIEWFHDWVDLHGDVTVRAGRSSNRSWLRFPRLADFEIDLGCRRIKIHALQGIERSTIRHLLLDQVIPRVLGQEGNLVLHAGAVQLASGKTVAFVGETGYGKSTLVSSFERNGARLITDDCALVVLGPGRASLIPNYAGVRLYDDSIRAIYGDDREVTEMAHYTTKRRLVVPADGNDCEQYPLDALFLLGNPAEVDPDRIVVEPAGGIDSLTALLAQCFVLDVGDKKLMARLFQVAGGLLAANLACNTLKFPHAHDRLAEVRAVVTERTG